MILLDTNIVSEFWKPRPSAAVCAWMDAQPASSLYLCTPVLAELRYGLELLDPSARKERMRALIERLETDMYRGRILALDMAAASAFGRLAARHEKVGRRMQPMDALIAAIASTHRMAVATRDTGFFSGLDIDVINPFDFTGVPQTQ